jgi:hypothetical protein
VLLAAHQFLYKHLNLLSGEYYTTGNLTCQIAMCATVRPTELLKITIQKNRGQKK